MPSGFATALQFERWPLPPDPLLAPALALVGATLVGEALARAVGVPRALGYGLVGLALSALGLVPGDVWGAAGSGGLWRLAVDLALGLLLFELGSRVRLRWLRANPALAVGAAVGALAGAAAVWATLRAFGFGAVEAGALAALLLPSSGAMIARVAAELRPSGQVAERMRVGAAVDTVLAVAAVALLIGWLHVDRAGAWLPALAQPLFTVGGSLALAAALAGAVIGLAGRLDLRRESAALLLLGLVIVATLLARRAGLSTLLVPLAGGLLLRNLDQRVWLWPRHFGSAGGVLVVLLFVAVGASASFGALIAGGGTALALLATRAFAKGAVALALAPASGIDRRQAVGLGLTLAPVSATSLVLWAELQRTHPAVAADVAPVLLSALTIMVVLGPLVVQWGLAHAGETAPARLNDVRSDADGDA
jgi:Kef-type K+ transport system membrane component KefB